MGNNKNLSLSIGYFIFLLIIIFSFPAESHAQVKEAVKTDLDYLLVKYSYNKTRKFEKIYSKLYPDKFDRDKIGHSKRGMFPDEFNLTDRFFVKLALRPVGKENYNALNIAGLYLREKRPEKRDKDFQHAFLDIELDSLTNWFYTRNDIFDSKIPEVEQLKIAYLKLLKENLFLITKDTYTNELKASNYFKGGYYDLSRQAVISILFRLLEKEKSPVVLEEIKKLIRGVPPKYKAPYLAK